MTKLVVDLLQQKGLGCWKVLKKDIIRKEKCFLSSQTWWSWQSKRACTSFWTWSSSCTRTLVTYARTIFKPRCCLNFQSMRTQRNLLILRITRLDRSRWRYRGTYIIRHALISSKRDEKPRMRIKKSRGGSQVDGKNLKGKACTWTSTGKKKACVLRCLRKSLYDFFPPSGTLLDLSGPFLSPVKGVLRYSVPKWLTFP